MEANIKLLSSRDYKELFISNLPADFNFQNTPLQIYDIGVVSQYLKIPTALLKPDFNFIVHLTSESFHQQIGTELKNVNAHSIMFIGLGYITALKKFPRMQKAILSSLKIRHSINYCQTMTY